MSLSLRKLGELRPDTRRRKLVKLLGLILEAWEAEGADPFGGLGPTYAEAAWAERALLAGEGRLDPRTLAPPRPEEPWGPAWARSLWALRADLSQALGQPAADWDFTRAPRDGQRPERRFPVAVWLEDVRSPFNVGSARRSAEALGAEALWLSRRCPDPESDRARRSAMGSELPVLRIDRSELPLDRPLVALELGGIPLQDMAWPEKGVLLVGSEEWGLSPEALAQAQAVVTIPLFGRKSSLNLGVALGIALQSWVQCLASGRLGGVSPLQ